jgi:hypothetical protein
MALKLRLHQNIATAQEKGSLFRKSVSIPDVIIHYNKWISPIPLTTFSSPIVILASNTGYDALAIQS